MIAASSARVNLAEFILLRIGYSIYAGWLNHSAIEILCFAAKYLIFGFGYQYEALAADIMLYVAMIIFMVSTYYLRNPLYGAIFIWSSYATSTATFADETYNQDVRMNAYIVCVLQFIFLIGYTYLYITSADYTQLSGLFFKISY